MNDLAVVTVDADELPRVVEVIVAGAMGPAGPGGGDGGTWFDFDQLDDVTGGTVAPGQTQIMVARRDTSSSAGPFVMRNAGLSAPPGGISRQSADGRYWQYYESVADCRKIGMSPDRDSASNGNLLREAVAYAVARKAAVYLPGAEAPYVVQPTATGSYLITGTEIPAATSGLAFFGAGIGASRIRLANGFDSGLISLNDSSKVSLRDFTFDPNYAGMPHAVNLHQIRLDNVDDTEVVGVEVLQGSGYGIGLESTGATEKFQRILLAHNRIYKSRLDSIDVKNPADTNQDFRILHNYVENHNYNRGDADGGGIDCRAPAVIFGNVVRMTDSLAQGVGIRARIPDAGPGSPEGGKKTEIVNNKVYVQAGHAGTTSGINAEDYYVTISGNYVEGVSTNAYGVNGKGTIVTDNRAVGCQRGFMCYSGLTDAILANNVVINPTSEGIRVDGATNLTLRGNKVVGNNGVGTTGFMEASTSPNLKTFENEVTGCATDVSGFAGANAVVQDNNTGRWPNNGSSAITGITVTSIGGPVGRKTIFTFTNVTMPLTDTPGVVARGSLRIFDFPEGVLTINGMTADLAITKSSAGVNADWDGDFSTGTLTAAGDAALTGFEANFIPSTATPQAVAGATTAKGWQTTQSILNGSTSPVDLYLNVLVDDADHDVTTTPCNLIFNGTLTVSWINAGDF